MEQTKLDELAKLLYGNYSMAVGGKAYNGDTLPTPEEFFNDPEKKKQADAWRSAAAASNTFFEVNSEVLTEGALRRRADKWDELDKQISVCYFNEDGTEKQENPEQDDLGYIGELAATAFGYL